MSAASSSKTGKISSLGQGTHTRTPQQRCTMSILLALCWQRVMFWLCASAGLKCKYCIAATATFKGSESANPSCLRWYLLNFCSCCKAASTHLVQSAERRVLNGNRSLAKQACFLSPEPFTEKFFWQWAQCSTSLRLHPPDCLTCLL